ncbi:hypothetical protein [Pelomonas cellulosilytica]|uniref:ABC transmembrane type-1 domain-containing protein n=1 Tax=Pelomonas cellulosilytica TaxID=2906762 RepID=A0ABS8XMZ3_9BURK|nr:hypothetical protein [Pelomonas sp. P8]MCE4554141.1 hypothetical protein [Pelomonas sp. P8]
MNALQQEWLALQSQHERYEALALAVKLVAFAATVLVSDNTLALALLVLLWLQEAVLKTFQGRLGDRLLRVEAALKAGTELPAMQLHSDWLAIRPQGVGLATQYLKSALRPTVALPYPLLMLLIVLA